jgi:ELWxxDGT repeat protein
MPHATTQESQLFNVLMVAILVAATAPAVAQVQLVEDINPGTASSVGQGSAALGDKVVFGADDGTHGMEPWVIDHTAGTTQMLYDILTLPNLCGDSSGAESFIHADGLVYFLAAGWVEEAATCKRWVWRTNGTTAGTEATTVIAGVNTKYEMSAINGAAFVGGSALLLPAWDPDGLTGTELWKIDTGAGGGEYAIADIWPGSGSSEPVGLRVVDLVGAGERLFFRAMEPDGSQQPWISDGWPGGTAELKEINTISGVSGAMDFTGFDGKAWFQADDGVNGAELWTSDGTTGGTSLFMNIWTSPPEYGSHPQLFTVAGDLMFFMAALDHTGYKLWVTDGTVGNTRTVVDGETGETPTNLVEAAAYNGLLYFDGATSNGSGLWVSDGTDEGTMMVAEIDPGSASALEDLTVADGKLFFTAVTEAHGRELWVSNGTEEGTMLVEDIYPGESFDSPNSSWPRDFVEVGDALYFFATDGTSGREPRKLPLTDFVTTPNVPSGPTSELINATHSYSAGGAVSLEGDDVQYRFHWGDETDSGWLSAGATSADHEWTEPGSYTVTVEARAAGDHGVVSRTSAGLEVEMLYDETISGTSITGDSSGFVGNDYTFTVDATSSKGHTMEFQVDWGDGQQSAWTTLGSGGSQVSHAWAAEGEKTITASVRCAEHTDSDDEADHQISIVVESLSNPTLTGPTTGGNGISYTYTLAAASNAGHDLEYWVSWGDGDPTPDIDWTAMGAGVTSVEVSHAWPDLGGYEVYAKVRCAAHQTIEKDVALWVSLEDEYIHSVSLDGPASGYVGTDYSYTISGESSWGHALEYAVSWGDGEGNDIDWTAFPEGQNTVTVSYAWNFAAPDFPVWAGVRCATHQELENGNDMTVEMLDPPAGLIFEDDFEEGDGEAWSTTVGGLL